MNTATANRFKVKGINDEQDTCMCCGKTGLKRVVWIEDTETLEVWHFGTTCAASPSKAFGVSTEIKKAIRVFDRGQVDARRKAYSDAMVQACRDACDSYRGAMRPGKFGPIPVDSDDFQAHKDAIIAKAKAEFDA